MPEALDGMGGAVAEVEGVGSAAFPQGVGQRYPVDGVLRHFPSGFEEGVVEAEYGVVNAVALEDGLEGVDDEAGSVVGLVVVGVGRGGRRCRSSERCGR